MICAQCNKEFTKTHHSQKYCSKKCLKTNQQKSNARTQKKYHQSDKGKETIRKATKKFRQSDKYKESSRKRSKKYQQTDKGKKTRKKYVQSDRAKKYQKSDRNKEVQKKFLQSDKGKEYIRNSKIVAKKYRHSDEGKAWRKKYEKSDAGIRSFKKYRQSDKFKSGLNKYEKERRKSDPVFKLTGNMRNRLNNFLKSTNIKKTNKTFQEVGCTPEFLKKHLEKQFKPGMTWKNHTRDGWHIDHRISLDSAKSREDLERLGVAHYTNLQPLWSKENIRKSNKILPD